MRQFELFDLKKTGIFKKKNDKDVSVAKTIVE